MASGGSNHHLFPSLGPALMVSMGYIDLGKWLAAVDGGARFGYDLVLFVLFFNFTAIFCQYLATCIVMVAERSLAEICSEEYSKAACIILGVQAELSMITSDLTMILGIAHGLTLLFGVDLFTCLCLATVVSIFLPFLITVLQDNWLTEALHIGIAGLALIFYVLGVLVSQPEVPLAMNVIFPKLSMESTCSLMALLGANVMAHNFYIHSSVVQQQRRYTSASIGALSHDHFFAILFVFTGIFLVNHVLMNSAAVVSSNPEVLLSFEDAFLLMDQIFKNPVAPIVFFLVLLFSSQINALICNSSGQLIMRHFIGINLSLSVHHLLFKALTIIPVLYCAKILGAEGTYQLFLFCQIIQAMLLPSSFIPLFRVASSRLIMGSFRLPRYLEIFALLAFVGMLGPNIIFIIEMSFGNSSWANSLRGNTGDDVVVPYTVLLLISCASILFTLYLAVTPLKSASNEPETQLWYWHSQSDVLPLSEGEDPQIENISFDEDQGPAAEPATEDPLECHPSNLTVEFPDLSEASVESGYESQPSSYDANITATCLSPTYLPEEPKSVVEVVLPETSNGILGGEISDSSTLLTAESMPLVEKDVEGEADLHMDNDNEKENSLDSEKPLGGTSPPSAPEDPKSFTGFKEKGYDANNDSGSLSKLSGLGRAARRQLAAILDEFWGHLFDFHGKLTREATMKKLDVLLGLDSRVVGPSVKMDTSSNESSKNPFKEDKGVMLSPNSASYISPSQNRFSDFDLSYRLPMGSPSWSQNMQLLNTQVQNLNSSILEPSEKLNSNFNMPPYSDVRDYQPATIHGYQIASYLKGISASRTPYSNISMDQEPSSKSSSSFIPSLGDSVMYAHGQNRLGSFGTSGSESPTAIRTSRLQTERSYYGPSLIESSENVGSSAYAKKYHSSPDISALIAASRSALLNEGNWGGPIGPRPSLGRMTSERSHYMNLASRGGVPIAFDELSPPKLHGNVFSSQSNLNPDASLWSRQPFEQLFGVTAMKQSSRDGGVAQNLSIPSKEVFNYAESETKLLQSLRFCIMKLLKLEGSEWLFRQNGGYDEGLIDRVAATERFLQGDASEMNQIYMTELQHLPADQKLSSAQRSDEADAPFLWSFWNCGDNCIWRAALVVSFGVWCIRRILELSLVESRPELWGKYTYVLNRLQGILEPAFSKTRKPVAPCSCLEALAKDMINLDKPLPNGLLCTIGKPIKGTLTTASMVLDIIKDVEISVSGRKGRTGTAAGDVAFPKGKENLSSVLKRYKRRLSSKSSNTNETTSRKPPSPTSSVL